MEVLTLKGRATLLLLIAGTSWCAEAQSIVPIPIGAGFSRGRATVMSADGATIGCYSYTQGPFTNESATYRGGALTSIGRPEGAEDVQEVAMSADGRSILCFYYLPGHYAESPAALWREGIGFEDLPRYQGMGTVTGRDGSHDMTTVVGYGGFAGGQKKAWVWRQDEGTSLLPDHGLNAEAHAVSLDGQSIGGSAANQNGRVDPVLWNRDGSWFTLGTIGFLHGEVRDVNRDGTVATGYLTNWVMGGQSAQPFLWSPATGMVDVGKPSGAQDVYFQELSPSGTVMSALFFDDLNRSALAIYSKDSGWRLFTDYLAAKGVNAAGWSNLLVYDIKEHDGHVLFVGSGTLNGTTQGFYISVPIDAVAPSAFHVDLGRLDAGDLQSLADEDGDALRVCKFIVPNQVVPPVAVTLEASAGSTGCTGLTFRIKSRMQQWGLFEQRVELWNWDSGVWDATDWRTDPVTTAYATFELRGTGDLGRYLDGSGRLKSRYTVRQTGPSAAALWCHETDQAVWVLTP